MKKQIAVFLSLAMAATACSPAFAGETEAQTEGQASGGAFIAGAETEADVTVPSDMKFGFIFLHDENSTYDLNFINGAKEAAKELGLSDDQVILKTNVPEGQECYETAADLADQGCAAVFADSFGHEDYMIQAAQEYPDVQFCHATGTKAHTEGLSNYHNAFAAIYEGRYLAGVAAGMKLNEMIKDGKITEDQAKIGYVGAFTYAEVISGFTSFFLGARSQCPSATMEVTFTGSWYDETAEKEGAKNLINDGCVLISQHADSMGAPTACEEAGVPDVSYNGSTQDACPNTYLISSRIDWAPYMKFMMQSVAEGKEIPADWTGTLASGSVKLTDLNTNVAAEGTQEKLDEVTKELEAGTLHVFDTSAFTFKGAALDDSYLADVDTDDNYTPDTKVVSDGYFHESEYRSAPYFDLGDADNAAGIDGIKLLDTNFG
ncbi:MAG TPA: BMP family ABC transporter substrate-binding protein [Lachnospiraceae bacterium]|nr:BMP family ABC transporter substrate-binding protein [Lachnospiraceae bacterium]